VKACTNLPCELELTDCPECQGEGGYGTHECGLCGGTGEVELCGGCGELPGVENGLEVCGCNRAAPVARLEVAA